MATHPLRPIGWLVALLSLAGCAPSRPQTDIPLPPGEARLWFYRDWLPSEGLNLANIDINGRYVGSVGNGRAFYVDLAPGVYHIAPQSWASDFYQDTNVALVPGQTAYVKILDLRSWALSVSASRIIGRDSYYAWLMPPQVAQAEIAHGSAVPQF
jgi:hypothetical protein